MPSFGPASIDFIHNGKGYGDVADRLLQNGMDINVLRPYYDEYGRPCVTRIVNGKPKVFTANSATLMRDQWITFDNVLVEAARPTLRAWGDLESNNLRYGIPNGMAVSVLLSQSTNDPGEAALDMDGVAETERFKSEFDTHGLPLPIVHSSFSFTARELAVSQSQQLPLDTSAIEKATRRCTEKIERLTLGTLSAYQYAGYPIYGAGNHPQRATKTLIAPTATGWTPDVTVDDVLSQIQQLQDIYFNGPYGMWYSPAWTKYLYGDYAATYGNKTLASRLAEIKDIKFMNKVDYLTGFRIIIFHLGNDVIQAVTGMKMKTVQWDVAGGLEKKFKVMGIMVPRVRKRSDDTCGISDGVAA